MIYQMFVRVKDYQMNGKAAILVISPLVSIIKDQIQDFKSIGYSAVDISDLTNQNLRIKVLTHLPLKVDNALWRHGNS